jgi:hypothetical protein
VVVVVEYRRLSLLDGCLGRQPFDQGTELGKPVPVCGSRDRLWPVRHESRFGEGRHPVVEHGRNGEAMHLDQALRHLGHRRIPGLEDLHEHPTGHEICDQDGRAEWRRPRRLQNDPGYPGSGIGDRTQHCGLSSRPLRTQ